MAITGAGTITGASVGVLDQASGAGGITLATGTGAITGKDTGIALTSLGAIALTTNGEVHGLGIFAPPTVTTGGGIAIVGNSSSALDTIQVTTNGQVFAAGGNGIDVAQTNSGGDITITAKGTIGSEPSNTNFVFNNGIRTTIADGSKANTTVNFSGNIGSVSDIGVGFGAFAASGTAAGSSNSGDLAINVANASAFGEIGGAFAQQNGLGAITITGTGSGKLVGDGFAETGFPIFGAGGQISGGGGGTITINVSQDAVGRTAGLGAITDGGGNISITQSGGTTGLFNGSASGAGILAQNTAMDANFGTIAITSNGPVSGITGILTDSGQSLGSTTITVNNTISATALGASGGTGVQSTSSSGDITLNIRAGGKIDPVIGSDQTTVSGGLTVNNAGLIQGDKIGVRQTSTGTGFVGDLTLAQTGTGTVQITAVGGGAQGVVLADHVKSADWREPGSEHIASVPAELLDEVRAKLKPLLGM